MAFVFKTFSDRLDAFPDLVDHLLALSEGNASSSFTSHCYSNYGYDSENGRGVFAVDALNWLLGPWQGGALSPDEQLVAFYNFLDDKACSFFISKALLDIPEGERFSPLSKMIVNMEVNTRAITSSICLIVAAGESLSFFPYDAVFPTNNVRELSQNMAGIAQIIDSFGGWNITNDLLENKQTHLLMCSIQAAIRLIRYQKNCFWKKNILDAEVVSRYLDEESGAIRFVIDPKPYHNEAAPPVFHKSGFNQPMNSFIQGARVKNGVSEDIVVEPEIRGQTFMQVLSSHVGLKQQKEALAAHMHGRVLNKFASYLQLKPPVSFDHILFVGSPGVGKTSFAKSVAKAMVAASYLPLDAPIGVVSCSSLVGTAVGRSEEKLLDTLVDHEGGVLVLDEIDTLQKVYGYGEDILNALNAEIGNRKNMPLLIGTLYPENERAFLAANRGLARRFPHIFRFGGYSDQELMSIFDHQVKQTGLSCPSGVRGAAEEALKREKRMKGSAFPQAGAVTHMVKEMWNAYARRLCQQYPELMQAFHQGDVSLVSDNLLGDARMFSLDDLPVPRSAWKNPLVKMEPPQRALMKQGKIVPLFFNKP